MAMATAAAQTVLEIMFVPQIDPGIIAADEKRRLPIPVPASG
jgi:hypothetical protein